MDLLLRVEEHLRDGDVKVRDDDGALVDQVNEVRRVITIGHTVHLQ